MLIYLNIICVLILSLMMYYFHDITSGSKVVVYV